MVAIPLFYDSTLGWSKPPTGPVTLEIDKDGQPVAQTAVGITVDSLPHASGTTAHIRDLIDSLATNLGAVLASAPVTFPWEQDLRDSVIAMMHGLADGGDSSLTAIINGTSPLLNGTKLNLELTDALLASTGAATYWEDLNNGLSAAGTQIRQTIAAGETRGILCRPGGPDMDLACKMQLYVILKNFEQEFLSQTAQEWDLLGGTLFSMLGYTSLVADSPVLVVADIIGAALTMADYVLKNQVLSLLPSHIISFDLSLAADSIDIGQHTNSQVTLMAMNSPATVTMNELIDNLIAGLGFGLPENVKATLRLFLTDIARFILDRLRSALIWLNTTYPDLNLDLSDPAVYTFPEMIFGPVTVTEPDLVRLVSYDENIARVDTVMFEWEGMHRGKVEIQAQTRGPGDRSKVIREWFCLCQYTGGAFGEDAAMTKRYQLTVGRPGELQVVIDGLPTGLDADVLVIYPDGTTFKHLTATETIPDLERGDYQVQASERTAPDGQVYVPDPASQVATVVGDSTTTVHITYTPKYGSMYLVVNGLDFGEAGTLPADIRVEGPDGYVRELTATTVLDSLLPGIYDVFAFDVDYPAGDQTYIPDKDLLEITVEGGQTSPVVVQYGPKYGFIDMFIDVPSGLEADVDVTGPNGYFRHLTASAVLDSLEEGDYTVNAHEIVDGNGDTLSVSPITQTVTVTRGQHANAAVHYNNNPALTIHVTGLPLGEQAIITVSSPNGYSALVTGDTVLHVESSSVSGQKYSVTAYPVTVNGATYRARIPEQSFYMYSDWTVTVDYAARARMDITLGREPYDPHQNPLIQATVHSRYWDAATSSWTAEDTTESAPLKDDVPLGMTTDSCGLWNERTVLHNSTHNYIIDQKTQYSNAKISMTLDVQDTSAVITFDGTINAVYPGDADNNSGWSSATINIDLGDMLKVLLSKPDTATSSVAQLWFTLDVSLIKPVTDTLVAGTVRWDRRHHYCGYPASSEDNWLSEQMTYADTSLTVHRRFGASLLGSQNGPEELKENIELQISCESNHGVPAHQSGEIHGTLEIILEQR
ncbi:MAG: hypothetical protein D6800_13340 [Candidatus Zixiibacteriota bacterium]|nr:MAG: hypothetical protein D6800_13340 [candidate division Zixibacteria bacterium]